MFTWIWRILVSLVGGVMWRIGGSKSKGVRRYGVAALLGGISFMFKKSWVAVLTTAIAVAAFSLGYGIPDAKGTDSGGTIAQFLVGLGMTNHLQLQIIVRLLCGFLYGLIALPTIIVLKNWKKLWVILIPTILVPLITLLPVGAVIEEGMIGFVVVFSFTLIVFGRKK